MTSLRQSIIVYLDGATCRAIGAVDRAEIAAGNCAATVIQDGLDFLGRVGGGKLSLEPGIFALDTPVRIPSRVALVGNGAGTVLRVMVANSDSVGLLCVGVHNASISDLTIEATDDEPAAAVGVALDKAIDCLVERVTARNFSRYGFALRNQSSLCKIHCCTGANNRESNFILDHLDAWHNATDVPGDFAPNYVSNCQAYAGGVGFEVRRSVCQNLVGCLVYNAGGHGFYVNTLSASTLISGCRSFQGKANGVLVEDSPEINISSSVLCWHNGHGVELRNVTWGAVSANEIMDPGVDRPDNTGHNLYLHADVKGVQVTGNALFTWADQWPPQVALFEDEDCRDNCITGNSINYFTEAGLISKGKDTIVANNRIQKIAYPNPDMLPFAQPTARYGNGQVPFDTSRMEAYIRSLRQP
jgi:hypothetical protein